MNAGDTWLISERLLLVSVPVYDLYTLSVCLFMCFVVVCVHILMLVCGSQPKAGQF